MGKNTFCFWFALTKFYRCNFGAVTQSRQLWWAHPLPPAAQHKSHFFLPCPSQAGPTAVQLLYFLLTSFNIPILYLHPGFQAFCVIKCLDFFVDTLNSPITFSVTSSFQGCGLHSHLRACLATEMPFGQSNTEYNRLFGQIFAGLIAVNPFSHPNVTEFLGDKHTCRIISLAPASPLRLGPQWKKKSIYIYLSWPHVT